ncbi:MAG: tripartite tricarboxylate transporter substrate-binding protein [Paracoccus sp. (in: a-proteobacteria)]|uniref:Bug family tripartite tricarboxylate transporter substrate binding protein n=1 Tax=Paracoccus sp. TaxID=267 RepID=UPI0026E05539|nr:tripartite tricarboxylate transporter substrate-binding protein [Paracoccus sp. (in: a-proteobacteria)]MDO5614092.1 tripartite tricarboxylate transporter substrate-binding protein [Paracoccus sp. (in: a-proteobacteria)]
MQAGSPLWRIALIAICAASLLDGRPAVADTARPDFTGTVVEWIIPFGEGGGSDMWARFLAPLIVQHLPGQPQAIVRNEYGGGGTRGANLFTAQARPDGRMVLGTSGSTQIAYMLGDLRVRYDYDDWDVLMATPTGGVVYVSADLGVGSWHEIADLQGQRLLYASMGPASLDLVPMLAFRLLGLDVRYVFGYTGRHDGLQAMQQGEISIDYQTTPAYLANVAPQVAQGRAVPLMTWGVLDADGRVLRDPTFPDLPTVEEVYELIHGAPPSGPDYEAYRAFATAGFAAQKMLVLPRETPRAIQDEWISAIRKALADPDYQAKAPARLGAYQTVVGQDAERLARSATHIAPEVRQNVLDMLASEYSVRLSE